MAEKLKKSAGKNKKGCELYKASHQREKNALRRLIRHLKRQPHDVQAGTKLEKLELYNVKAVRAALTVHRAAVQEHEHAERTRLLRHVESHPFDVVSLRIARKLGEVQLR